MGTALLGAGIWLGTASTSSPPAVAAVGCRVTSVDVTVHNKTGEALKIDSARLGQTNKWCQYPGNPVSPGSTTRFEAGDDFFATDIRVSYVAPNYDLITLFAKSGYTTDEARCIVVPNGTKPSPFRCSASSRTEVEDRGGAAGTHVVLVNWVLERP
jgi:hypothetical protein